MAAKKSLFNFFFYLIAFIGGAGATFWVLSGLFFNPIRPGASEPISFEVSKGWDFKEIAKKLQEKELVKQWWAFYLFGQLSEPERLTKIQWGEYQLSKGQTPKEILADLINGKIIFHELTVPEGATVKEIARLMEKTTLATLREAEAALSDKALITKLLLQNTSFEGYLFPSTYRFTRPQNVEHMITTLVTEGQKRVTDEFKGRAKELGMTWQQVLTLASIIEKETGSPADRGKISSVFHNRLRIGMPLQSDPTVIYGLPVFDGNLRKEDLQTPSAYNTYLNTGLTPTPICNPGVEAIQAALYPDESDYLYFVAKGDGTSHFSPTYREHQAAVRRYQLGGGEQPQQQSAATPKPAPENAAPAEPAAAAKGAKKAPPLKKK